MGFSLWTDALDSHGGFDARYTCDLDNSSPEVRWDNPPVATHAFALLVEDLDALAKGRPFVHWTVYRIAPELRHLPTGIPVQDTLPNGIRQGLNDFGKLGYSGPCPPFQDHAHHYRFRLLALGAEPDLPPRVSVATFLQAVDPWVLGSAEFVGTYERALRKAG